MRGSNMKCLLFIMAATLSACTTPQIQQPSGKVAAVYASPKTHYFEAARKGDIATIMRLVEEKIVDVRETDSYSWTGFMYAIQYGHAGLADYFIIRKINVNIDRKSTRLNSSH